MNGKKQTPLVAAESGGRHSGFLRQRLGKTSGELLSEAKTLRRRAAEHKDKITNRIGYGKVSDDPVIQARADAGRTRHLQKEIENFTNRQRFAKNSPKERRQVGHESCNLLY